MFHFLVILMLGANPQPAQMQAHEDSLIIYNAYKSSVRLLKETTDMHQWYKMEDTLSFGTACAFRRLKLYNNEEYKPLMVYEKKGMGVAPYYPPPSDILNITPDLRGDEEALSLYRTTAYSVIGQQTKFLLNDKGRSVAPYIERVYFDAESNIIKIVKLNPITHLPLIEQEPEFYLTSN